MTTEQLAICKAVREAGEYLSDDLYDTMFDLITPATYENLVQQLCRIRVIDRRGGSLVWIGPEE